MRTDSSAKQKSIGLLADGWGSTLSQTLSLCSRPVRHPSCEWTHCAHSVSLCELPTSTHYVWRRQKLIIRTVGHKQPFEVLRIQQLPPSYRPGFVLFHSIQINHRHSAIPLYHTRQEGIVALVSGDDCDASVGLCFFAILFFKDKETNAGVQDLLQRIERQPLHYAHPSVWNKIFQAFWHRQFKVGISLTYCLFQILSMCLNYYMFAVFLTHRVAKLWNMKLLNYTCDNASFLTKVSATNMGDCTCTGLVKQVDWLWPDCSKYKIHKKPFYDKHNGYMLILWCHRLWYEIPRCYRKLLKQ